MSYYHHLFKKFDNCPVLVAFTNDWQQLVTPQQFSSLMAAVEHILDQQKDLKFVVVTAHTHTGPVDLDQGDLLRLINLAGDIRHCQD